MKNLLTIFLLLLLSTALSGHSIQFKSIKKNQPGTTNPGISFLAISNRNSMKSASSGSFPFPKAALHFPGKNPVKLKTIYDSDSSPVYMERNTGSLKSAVPAEEKFFIFFEETSRLTGIRKPRESFRIEDIRIDAAGITHIRSVQVHKGIEIYGSHSVFHISHEKERFTGRIFQLHNDIELHPAISPEEAQKIAIADLKTITTFRELSEKEKQLLQYREPESRTIIYETAGKTNVLAHEIEIRPNIIEVWNYLIHAGTGEILRKFNGTHSDGAYTASAVDLNGILRTIDTYLDKGTYYMVNISETMFNAGKREGMIITLDAGNTSTKSLNYREITSSDNSWDAPAAVSAHYNATLTYKYFQSAFKRNSINGQGGNIFSFVNVAEDDGSSMENAFWNGKAVFYGNGGDIFKPLAGALDVTAHELGHGVVSGSANLEYYGQSGAINETYADIFGSMVDRDDWLIGEDITRKSYFPSGAMRDMADPHNTGVKGDHYWQPKHVSEMYLGSEDNAGVHINSGIGNHAYYIYAASITKDTAEQVFYHALTYYLTKTSKFIDFRIAVIQSARDLYPGRPYLADKAADAFDKVGIYQENQIKEQQNYAVNEGEEFLLWYNTNLFYSGTLYQSTASGTQYKKLTSTPMKRKPSVTDNGTIAVFVSTDDKIRMIDLKSGKEQIIQDSAFWENVAISKDGNHLAAISNEKDTAIYMYNFESGKWAKFRLYNPTTSHFDTDAGGVLEADALEFDHTGQYLMYDAFNKFTSSLSEDISYWDIGFIRVWDNNTNNFGDGSISKLFGSLPENVSVGNAVFSKNSANIIAFDYIDGSEDEYYAVLGADLETGNVDVIYENVTLGYPSFSKNDSEIAFSAISTSDAEVIGIISLDTGKISPLKNSQARILVDDAKWPVFYSTGTRLLGLPPVANFSADRKSGEAPLTVQFLDLSVNSPASWRWYFPGGTPSSSTLQNPVITYNTSGIFPVSLTVLNNNGNDSITKSNYITVSPPTSAEIALNETVTIYPNPVRDFLYISAPRDFKIRLYNPGGIKILEETNARQTDLSRLSPGIYLLEITLEDKISMHRILKQ